MLLARLQCEDGRVPEAWSTIEHILADGVRLNEVVIHSFLVACSKDQDSAAGRNLIDRLLAAKEPVSQTSFSLLIKLHGRCRQLDKAFDVFEEMHTVHGVAPSSSTALCLVDLCVQGRELKMGLAVLERAKALLHPISPDPQ